MFFLDKRFTNMARAQLFLVLLAVGCNEGRAIEVEGTSTLHQWQRLCAERLWRAGDAITGKYLVARVKVYNNALGWLVELQTFVDSTKVSGVMPLSGAWSLHAQVIEDTERQGPQTDWTTDTNIGGPHNGLRRVTKAGSASFSWEPILEGDDERVVSVKRALDRCLALMPGGSL